MVAEIDDVSKWCSQSGSAVDVESRFFDITQPAKITKLQLARLLLVSVKEPESQWKRLSYLGKTDLTHRLLPAPR